MTVFTYEKVKALMDAAEALITDLVEADGDYNGRPVYEHAWNMRCAWKALTEEDTDALPISGDDTVPLDATDDRDLWRAMPYFPDPE